jgi:hypothetical protein
MINPYMITSITRTSEWINWKESEKEGSLFCQQKLRMINQSLLCDGNSIFWLIYGRHEEDDNPACSQSSITHSFDKDENRSEMALLFSQKTPSFSRNTKQYLPLGWRGLCKIFTFFSSVFKPQKSKNFGFFQLFNVSDTSVSVVNRKVREAFPMKRKRKIFSISSYKGGCLIIVFIYLTVTGVFLPRLVSLT